MSVRFGDHEFERAVYDEEGDVLYLLNGEPGKAASTQATPEGHAVRFDEQGKMIGLTIVNARWLVERDQEVVITIPQSQIKTPADELALAMEHSLNK